MNVQEQQGGCVICNRPIVHGMQPTQLHFTQSTPPLQ